MGILGTLYSGRPQNQASLYCESLHRKPVNDVDTYREPSKFGQCIAH